MPDSRTNKERVNITVDPHVHRAFSADAEKQGQTVSGILNTVMAFYSGKGEAFSDDNPIVRRLREVLGGDVSKADYHRIAGELLQRRGCHQLKTEETEPSKAGLEHPSQLDEWIDENRKQRTGYKIVSCLNSRSDLVLGQALMLRARLNCDHVFIVVPFKTGLDEAILNTIKHAGLSVVSLDELESLTMSQKKTEGKREENRKRLSHAQEELDKLKKKRTTRNHPSSKKGSLSK